MNPVFVFLVIIGAALLWLLCSFAFRLIGKVVEHLVGNAKKAMDDEPSNAEMFVRGFGASFRNKKEAENEKEERE